MKISKFVQRYISKDYKNDYKLSCVYNELIEVFSATSLENLKEELNDVSFTFQSWLHLKLHIHNVDLDWEMIWQKPSIKKMEDRLLWWTKHFQDHSLVFDPKYWINGSNYKKEYKVFKAITKAIQEQIIKGEKNESKTSEISSV